MTDRTQNKKTDSQNYGETLAGLLSAFLFYFPVVTPAGSPGLSGESGLRGVGRETEGWGDSSRRRSHSRHQVAPLDYRAAAESGGSCRSPLITRCILAVTLCQSSRVVIAPSFSHRGVTSGTFCTDQGVSDWVHTRCVGNIGAA